MINSYLTDREMASLVEAIKTAEDLSTGEIRIHIDSTTVENNAEVALKVFNKLNMHLTEERNGVLFHVNFEQKYLTILGDIGIHAKVKQVFWDTVHDEITALFAQGKFYQGLYEAIEKTGRELRIYFPINGKNPNELPNEISFS